MDKLLNGFDYTRAGLTFRLVAMEVLIELLGYTSIKGLSQWCDQHKVPIVKLGKNSYVLAKDIDRVIAEKVGHTNGIIKEIPMKETPELINHEHPKLLFQGSHSKAAEKFLAKMKGK